jgi:hypothetical protein
MMAGSLSLDEFTRVLLFFGRVPPDDDRAIVSQDHEDRRRGDPRPSVWSRLERRGYSAGA